MIVLTLLLVTCVSAQTIFSPPYPVITIRDQTTHIQYNAQLVGFATPLCVPSESDGGINPFEQGTNIMNIAPGAPPIVISDWNINTPTNADIFEFVSSNYEVLLPSGWTPVPSGITIAVVLSGTTPGLASENGLGSPTFANAINPTGYGTPYSNRHGVTVSRDRLYAAPKSATDNTFLSQVVFGTNILYSILEGKDLKDTALALTTTDPLVGAAITIQPSGPGGCPPLSYPAYTFLDWQTSTCYYFNQYVGYVDYSAITTTNEAQLPISPATPAIQLYSGALGVFENNPSISRDPAALAGAYLVARETNVNNIGTALFDINVFNTNPAFNIDTFIIPELSGANLNQIYPDFSYPFIAFLEIPSGTYPGFPNGQIGIGGTGSLHLQDIVANVRTTIPIANAFGFPRLIYNPSTSNGIVAYMDASTFQLSFVTFSSTSFPSSITAPVTIPVPPNFGMSADTIAVTINPAGSFYVYYAGYDQTTFSIKIYRYDVAANTNTLIYADTGVNGWYQGNKNDLSVSHNNRLVSVGAYPSGGGVIKRLLLNINSYCSSLPCYVYESSFFWRNFNLPGGGGIPSSYFWDGSNYILDNELPTQSGLSPVAGIGPSWTYPYSTTAVGFLDISNL